MWRRLDLTEDEWLECQRSAAEMSLATRISARQVAVEYALARGFEEAVAPAVTAFEQARSPSFANALTN